MATGKTSFILYSDLVHTLRKLVNEDRKNNTNNAGELFLHLLEYVNDTEPEPVNMIVDLTFEPIKQHLKRDLKKFEHRADRSRENGKLGGRPKNPEKPTGLKNNLTEPRKPDSDNDSDNVNVSDSVNEKKTTTDIFLCSISDEIELSLSLHQKIAFAFWRMFRQNVINSGIKPTTIDKAKLEDWTRHVRLAFEQDGRTADQFKFIGEFLKRSDFWKKNIRSTDKLRAQFERLYIEAMDKVGKDDPLFELKQKLYVKYHTKE